MKERNEKHLNLQWLEEAQSKIKANFKRDLRFNRLSRASGDRIAGLIIKMNETYERDGRSESRETKTSGRSQTFNDLK
jgi:hypothetical protein